MTFSPNKRNRVNNPRVKLKPRNQKKEKLYKKTGLVSPGVLPWGNALGNPLEAGTTRWRIESLELRSLR